MKNHHPSSLYQSAEAPLFVSFDEQEEAFNTLTHLHREVSATSNPNVFSIKINDVALEGTPPQHLPELRGYKRLGFTALRNYHQEAAVDINLIGANPTNQIQFSSSPNPVDFAHHKIFTVRKGTEVSPHNSINFDSLAYLLGDYVPVSVFTQLSDPRSSETFDEAALKMSDGLEALDSKRRKLAYTDRRGFNSHDEQFQGEDLDYIQKRNAQLLVTREKLAGKDCTSNVALELNAPLEVHEHLVQTIFRYTLTIPTSPYQVKTASAKVIVRSASAPQRDIEWAVKSRQEDTETLKLIHDAVAMIRSDHTDKR